MRTALVVLGYLAFGLATAHANPVTVKLAERDVYKAFSKLVERLEEPVGLAAPADIPQLALKAGDIVRAVNGMPARYPIRVSATLLDPADVYLQVLRGKKTFYVRVAVLSGPQELPIERVRLERQLARVRKHGSEHVLRPVTKKGGATGLLIVGTLFVDFPILDGVIIRKVDGMPFKSADDLLVQLEAKLVQGKIVLDVERVDQAFTITLLLDDQAVEAPVRRRTVDSSVNDEHAKLFADIKKVDDTTFEIPVALRDVITAKPSEYIRGARIVPAVKDGKPDGLKVYAVRPSSIFAALGITNGDTIRTFNGVAVTDADKLLEQMKTAKQIKVELRRRGKDVTLQYKIK